MLLLPMFLLLLLLLFLLPVFAAGTHIINGTIVHSGLSVAPSKLLTLVYVILDMQIFYAIVCIFVDQIVSEITNSGIANCFR